VALVFNIFQKKSNHNEFHNLISELNTKSLDEFIYSLSHLEKHTLAIAIYNASRLINFLDRNNEFIPQQRYLENQADSKPLQLAEFIISVSQQSYLDNKEAIDANYKKHLN
jgi:hypothetical protein